MWPGTSRSLVTIVGGLAIGLSMAATLEFSFLLGFITLSAASVYSLKKQWHPLMHDVGISNLTIGLLVSWLFAVVSVKWMIGYLRKHSLSGFGWYRVALAVVVAILLLTGLVKSS